jgi:hypothetical protein
MLLKSDTVLAPRGETLHASIDEDEAVLMSVDAGKYFALNAVGTRVWELLVERPRTIVDLSATICEEFEVERPACQADITTFAQSLIDAGIVHEVVR